MKMVDDFPRRMRSFEENPDALSDLIAVASCISIETP
jgi:hypothetical protein